MLGLVQLQQRRIAARSWQVGEDGVVANCGDGFLEVRQGIPVLHLKGDAYQRGLQQGTLLKEQIAKFVPTYKDTFLADQYRDRVMEMSGRLERNLPEEIRQEARGLADGSEQDYDELVAANLAYDIIRLAQCSQFMVLEEHAKQGLVHGRNFDYYGGGVAQSYTVLFVVEPDQGIPFVHVGFVGSLGAYTAINAEGLALAVNTLDGITDEQGTPLIAPFLEALTTCSTVEEAVQVFTNRAHLTGNNVGISDSETAVILELGGGRRVNRRDPEDGWLAATNSASPVPGGICWRYSALHQRLSELQPGGAFTVEDSISLLDTVALNGSGLGGSLGPSSTLHSVVFEPANRRLHLGIRGIPATTGEFLTFSLDELFNR